MLRVGIVAEGQSDWLVLEEIIRSVEPEVEFERLRPDLTLISGSPHGWKGVRRWCIENGARLEMLMSGVTSRPLHALVVHADCSMAQNEGARRPCPPARDTADALRDVMLRDWLQRTPPPPSLVVVTPAQTTDAWVVAALSPPYTGRAGIECDDKAEQELARRRLLKRGSKGEVKKPVARYGPLAAAVPARWDAVSARCPEAARFRKEIAAALSAAATTAAGRE